MAYRCISLYTTLFAVLAIRDRFRFLVPGTSAACETQSTRTCSSRTSWPTSSGSSRLLSRLACHDNETIPPVSNYQTFCSCTGARPTRDPASLSYFCITSIWPTSSGCSSKVYTACNIMSSYTGGLIKFRSIRHDTMAEHQLFSFLSRRRESRMKWPVEYTLMWYIIL